MTYVYFLRSIYQSSQLYIGVSDNLGQRLQYHNSGRCPHTSKFMPWEIVYTEEFDNRAEAISRERQIKCWTRAKKEALVVGDRKMLKSLAKSRIY